MTVFLWERIAEIAMWLAVGAAIIVSLFLTQRITALWFFMIPAMTQLAMPRKQ